MAIQNFEQKLADDNFTSENLFEQQTTRRNFLKTVGIGLGGILLGGIGLPKISEAQEDFEPIPQRITHRTNVFSTHLKKLPKAVLYASEHYGLKEAWAYHHFNIHDTYGNNSGTEAARKILGFNARDSFVSGRCIPKNIWKISHVGFLLARKVGGSGGNIPEDNPSLKQYVIGINHFYKKEYSWGKKRFSNGIFTAAELNANDFERIKNNGTNVHYDHRKNIQENATHLANKFNEMDLEDKETVLNAGIWHKFKDVPVKHGRIDDYHSPEYKMKSLYWNLGFYILAHYMVGKITPYPEYKYYSDEAIELRNKKDTYPNFWNKFKYNTANMDLI